MILSDRFCPPGIHGSAAVQDDDDDDGDIVFLTVSEENRQRPTCYESSERKNFRLLRCNWKMDGKYFYGKVGSWKIGMKMTRSGLFVERSSFLIGGCQPHDRCLREAEIGHYRHLAC